MSSHVAFSRLQLAAALIEYDNDTDNPNGPKRSAQESAIFAHFRQNPAIRPNLGSRKSDYLGVSLPSETCSPAGMESNLAKRRSRSSLDALRNPFGVDNQSELGFNDEDEEELEVDLESWGLDAFVSKDKNKSKGKEPAVGSTRSQQPCASYESSAASPRRGVVTSKSVSLGGQVEFRNALSVDRRRSLASPLELAGMESDILFPPRSPTSRTSFTQPMPQGLPDSPPPNDEPRTQSTDATNSNSQIILNAPERRQRSASISTLEMLRPTEDNPFAIERPSHTSRFDPKATDRPRSYSNASMDSRLMQETDDMPENPCARERPYSTMDLLRPKVLVMPSPLQPIAYGPDPEPTIKVRYGFELSTDGPPLPPGARSSRRLSSFSALNPSNVPVTSNVLTPNSLQDLSLSQKTFRNTLVIGDQPSLMEFELPRATQDGDQVQLEPPVMQHNFPTKGEEIPSGSGRPAGKLFGKSLIDDLEARKAELRSKQRVFKGDDRPSMMARKQLRTLIDPASLVDVTMSQQVGSGKTADTNPVRRGSLSTKPLLDFNSNEKTLSRNVRAETTQVKENRSVFGIDTLWESEMEKLKEIQLREAQEVEEDRKAEAESERKKHEKKKHKKRGNTPTSLANNELQERVDASPPTLPKIQRASARRLPPKPSDVEEPSDTDDEQHLLHPVEETKSWYVGSSDEDHGPQRTTGVGLRYPKRVPRIHHPDDDDDSEEDLPLVATVHKAKARATLSSTMQVISDDEDKPLAQVIRHAIPSSIPSVQPRGNFASDSNSEDEQPLALRASRLPRNRRSIEDEDDMPLALQSQQRQTQYQMLAQQQQQRQLLMQAQMQNNMFMNLHPPMMGGFYGAVPLLNAVMPMQAPVPIPSPPPAVDDVNFGRVDRWRRDVVVDGGI